MKRPGVCTRVGRSKLGIMTLNFLGAIACILVNKHVMSRGFNLPLTLTLFGYSSVSVILLVYRDRRREIERITTWRAAALVCFTALAPALANASLGANSVGFTQLSKVLTTPCIVLLERSRGVGVPLSTRRLFWLVVVHIGVLSATDVTMSRRGAMLALANVLVTAKYKVEWTATCRDRVKLYAGAARAATPADEVAALRDVVELTLPRATLCLLPLAVLVEGRKCLALAETMDARTCGFLGLAAVLGAWTSFTGYAVIGRLSALTHQILGQFKYAVLALASIFLFGADFNRNQVAGSALTMCSIVAYTKATVDQRRKLDARRGVGRDVLPTRAPPLASSNDDAVRSRGSRGAPTNGHHKPPATQPGASRKGPSPPPPSSTTRGAVFLA